MKKPLLILLAILAIGMSSCKNKEDNPFDNKLGDINAKSDPAKVLGEVSIYGDFPLELVSTGKLQAFQKASLQFKTIGTVKSINYINGQIVKSGELIAELENSMEKLDLEQAKLRLERASLDRKDRIVSHAVGASEPEDVPEDALKLFNMVTGYNEAKLSLEQAQLKFEYTRLFAPFTGRIANLETKTDNSPKAGEPFCVLIDDSKFEVLFPVLESEINRISVG